MFVSRCTHNTSRHVKTYQDMSHEGHVKTQQLNEILRTKTSHTQTRFIRILCERARDSKRHKLSAE